MNIILSVETDNKNCKQVFFFSKFAVKTTLQALCGNSYVPLDLYFQSVLYRPRKGFDVTLLHKIEKCKLIRSVNKG